MFKKMLGAMGGGAVKATAGAVRAVMPVGADHERPSQPAGGGAAHTARRMGARGQSGGTSTLGGLAGGISAFAGGMGRKKKPGTGSGGAGGSRGTLGRISNVMKRGGY